MQRATKVSKSGLRSFWHADVCGRVHEAMRLFCVRAHSGQHARARHALSTYTQACRVSPRSYMGIPRLNNALLAGGLGCSLGLGPVHVPAGLSGGARGLCCLVSSVCWRPACHH